MEINSESVKAYTTLLKDPKTHGLPIRPLSECFEPATEATPKHILFKDYQNEVGDNVPKVFFYIIMDAEYSDAIAKASTGEGGHKLRYIPAQPAPVRGEPAAIPLTPSYRFMLLVKEWNGYFDTVPTREGIERMRVIVTEAKAIKDQHPEDIAGLIYQPHDYTPAFEIMPGVDPLIFP